MQQVAGAYRITRRSYTKLEGMVGLGGDITVQAAGDNAIVIPVPQLGGRFEETEPYVFTKVGKQSSIAFGTDDSGEVTHLFLAIVSADKLGLLDQASTHQTIIALAVLAALFVCINGIRNRGQLQPGPARTARLMTYGAAVSILLFGIGMAVVMGNLNMSKVVFDFPPSGVGLLLIFPILTALFTVGALLHLRPVWQAPECGVWARLRYTYVALVFLALVGVFYYWNMLGWNYY